MLQDCTDFTVDGDITNTVNGNQYNASVMNFGQVERRERTEYDEFEEVKRGQIYTLKRLHTENPEKWWDWELKDEELVRTNRSAQRTICTVQVRPDQQTKYTVAIYEGKDAHVWWKRDFERFSSAGLGAPDTWQLYGLNRSKIPLLIFHDELVPLANFYKKSFWGDFYLYNLIEHLDCRKSSQIWLNMGGNLCKGLDGPLVYHCRTSFTVFNILVPPSAQMLQDDIFINFLQQSLSSPLDQYLLKYVSLHQTSTFLNNLLPEPTNYHPSLDYTCFPPSRKVDSCLKSLFHNSLYHLPLDIINGLRFDTVYSTSRGAVARWPRGKSLWKAWSSHGLVNETDMGDGSIRFKLYDPEDVAVSFKYAMWNLEKSWLMQSSRIIDAHGMLGIDEKCFIIDPPTFGLHSYSWQWSRHWQYPRYHIALKHRPPIYLFIYPLFSVSELVSWEMGHTQAHFWSLDKNGQSEMSNEERRRWGVPELRSSTKWGDRCLFSWPTHIYTALRKWQVARSFDPTTADWAQSHGYPELEIISGKKEEAQFEGVQDYVSYLRKLHKQDVELQLQSPVQVQRLLRTRRYSWPTNVYTGLHNQQVARSFKCSECTKWTRSLGSLEFEFIGVKKGEARFEELPDHAYYLRNLREQYAELQRRKSLLAAKGQSLHPPAVLGLIPHFTKAKAEAEAEVKSESIAKLNDILESSAFLRAPSIESVENTPQASPYDEQGALPEQNDPLFAQG
ncbi:hypothetical protein VNI00_015732 [Paramarasmius palmivorus]|uniref:Uncharacterized protein n=1 Tax=Paramarasmius palmivorus TaxID=297713 RepID=A0AAW0BHW3_9AGAR